jgi:Na+-translocating ferredoxin:NAD+ oxidoreductase subunit A
MKEIIVISLGAIFINNFILVKFLGLCSFTEISKNYKNVFGMGLTITFIMTLASMITYFFYKYLLVPLSINFLSSVTFIIIITLLIITLELFLKKSMPNLYNLIGVYLPLIAINCAILGITIININQNYTFITSTLNAFMSGIGYLFVLYIMGTLKEKLDLSNVPEPFKGLPIAFISAGIMALAFFAIDKTMLEYFK